MRIATINLHNVSYKYTKNPFIKCSSISYWQLLIFTENIQIRYYIIRKHDVHDIHTVPPITHVCIKHQAYHRLIFVLAFQ